MGDPEIELRLMTSGRSPASKGPNELAPDLGWTIAFRVPSAARDEIDTSNRLILRCVAVVTGVLTRCTRTRNGGFCVGRLRQAERRERVSHRDDATNADQR